MSDQRTPLSAEEIKENFAEIDPPMTIAEAKFEANRCLYCYDALISVSVVWLVATRVLSDVC